jgi:hypothetical protein
MALHLHSITFDAADPQALAGFWADVTGYQAATVNEFVAILGGDGSVGPSLMFIKVPEGKTAKNACTSTSVPRTWTARRNGSSASAPSSSGGTTSTA